MQQRRRRAAVDSPSVWFDMGFVEGISSRRHNKLQNLCRPHIQSTLFENPINGFEVQILKIAHGNYKFVHFLILNCVFSVCHVMRARVPSNRGCIFTLDDKRLVPVVEEDVDGW